MAQRRHHYEQAFERYVRERRIPYVAVNEARKALLPGGRGPDEGRSLKSFDFVIYGEGSNLLVEVKGRRLPRRSPGARRPARLDSWVHGDDVDSLLEWEGLFGPDFQAAFVFVYWCDDQPPDPLFEEVLEHRERWYAFRAVRVSDYAAAMRTRSPRWGTVYVDAATFDRISGPLASPRAADPGTCLPVFAPLGGPPASSDRE